MTRANKACADNGNLDGHGDDWDEKQISVLKELNKFKPVVTRRAEAESVLLLRRTPSSMTIRHRFSGYIPTSTVKTLSGIYGYFPSKDRWAGSMFNGEAKFRVVGGTVHSRRGGIGGKTKAGQRLPRHMTLYQVRPRHQDTNHSRPGKTFNHRKHRRG